MPRCLAILLTKFDFTSSLYLGLCHPSGALAPYSQLTLGVPAAVRSPAEAEELAGSLARLIGCSAAILATSTLHIFWDLFCILGQRQSALLIVGEIYPIALWGIERAGALGVRVARVASHDLERVLKSAQAWSRRGVRPIIVTDGIFFPEGRIAPLGAYAEIAAATGGLLVIDDTQALGILGNAPTARSPYGRGGGGSFRFHDLTGPHLVAVCSLAKALGVPVAVLAASRPVVRRFATESATRRHSSPPSMAVLAAGIRAISINSWCGEHLRARLLDNIRHFRHMLTGAGLQPTGGLMPVQTLSFRSEKEAGAVHAGLTRAGIRALVAPEPVLSGGRIIFVITAKHQPIDLERAALALKRILSPSIGLSSGKESKPDQPGTVREGHEWTWSRALPPIKAL
jgi:8-amino-7-oxononanoate synthase